MISHDQCKLLESKTDEILQKDIARHLYLIWKNMRSANVKLQLCKINQHPWNRCQPESQIYVTIL